MFSLTMSCSLPPAASATSARLSNTRQTWASKPSTTSMVFGSSGIWPDRYTVLPTLMAWEYVPIAAGACSLVMTCLFMNVSIGCSVLQSSDPHDALQHADPFDQLGQVQAAANAQHQLHHADAAVALVDADLVDAGVGDGDAGGQLGDDAPLVFQLHAQLHGEFATDVLVPGQLQDLFIVTAVLRQVLAVFLVDDHALAGGDETDNGVARDGVAAAGEADHQ